MDGHCKTTIDVLFTRMLQFFFLVIIYKAQNLSALTSKSERKFKNFTYIGKCLLLYILFLLI